LFINRRGAETQRKNVFAAKDAKMRKLKTIIKLFLALFAFFAAIDAVNIFSVPNFFLSGNETP
jgi:hypothetical protein